MHATFNYCEAVFWAIVALVIFIASRRAAPNARRIAHVAVPVLILFGVSDIVEVYTRTWWRPIWLLLWKGLCIAVLVACFVCYLRTTKPAGATKHPDAGEQQ